MAEEKMDQPTNGGSDETNDSMPPKGDENSNVSQTKECILKFIDDPLKGAIKQTKSEEIIACISYKGKLNDQEYKLCKLLKTRKMHDEYFGIKNTVSTTFLEQACQIDTHVDGLIEKSQVVTAALDRSLNAIKTAKSKLWEVREAACKLDGARNDSCNSEQLSAMSKIPSGDPDNKSGIARFQALVDQLKDRAFNLYDEVDDVFEKGVKVAGIQAYMNIVSMKKFSTSLKTGAETFDTDVNSNLAHANEQITSTQATYTEGLQLLDKCMFEKTIAHLSHSSLEATETYANNLETEPCNTIERTTEELESICDQIKAVFKAQINCEPNASNP